MGDPDHGAPGRGVASALRAAHATRERVQLLGCAVRSANRTAEDPCGLGRRFVCGTFRPRMSTCSAFGFRRRTKLGSTLACSAVGFAERTQRRSTAPCSPVRFAAPPFGPAAGPPERRPAPAQPLPPPSVLLAIAVALLARGASPDRSARGSSGRRQGARRPRRPVADCRTACPTSGATGPSLRAAADRSPARPVAAVGRADLARRPGRASPNRVTPFARAGTRRGSGLAELAA